MKVMESTIDIEGVGYIYTARLRAAGIHTTDDLLWAGRTPTGRDDVADRTGISRHLILKWVNHADLFRVKGVAGPIAELLEAAGVGTLVELGRRNPVHLAQQMRQVDDERRFTSRAPSTEEVAEWIGQAKSLPRVVEY